MRARRCPEWSVTRIIELTYSNDGANMDPIDIAENMNLGASDLDRAVGGSMRAFFEKWQGREVFGLRMNAPNALVFVVIGLMGYVFTAELGRKVLIYQVEGQISRLDSEYVSGEHPLWLIDCSVEDCEEMEASHNLEKATIRQQIDKMKQKREVYEDRARFYTMFPVLVVEAMLH